MSPAATLAPVLPSPPERFARIIDELCKALAAHGIRGLMTAPLLLLLWSRLKRMAARARSLAARLAAGAPLTATRTRGAAQRPAPSRPSPPRLPRGSAWLVRMVRAAAPSASQLRALLTDPEMAALVAAPALRRLVRPLCQMLGVQPPPVPRRPAPPPADPPASVQPAPAAPPPWSPDRPSALPLCPPCVSTNAA